LTNPPKCATIGAAAHVDITFTLHFCT